MIIDFAKIASIQLPPFLRQNKVLSFMHALVVKHMQRLYMDYIVWKSVQQYKIHATPQVLCLEEILYRLCDTNAVISELDGKPYDFLVTVDKSGDLSAIKQYLNTYKQPGKSYVFELGDVSWSCDYISHVDEDMIEEYLCEYIDHISEDDGIVNIRVYLTAKRESGVTKWFVYAVAEKALNSSVTVLGNIKLSNYNTLIDMFSLTIPKGDTYAESPAINYETPEHDYSAYPVIDSTTLNWMPKSDDLYQYNVISK